MLATKWGINILMSQTAITAEVMKKVCKIIAKVLQTDLILKVGFLLSLFLVFFFDQVHRSHLSWGWLYERDSTDPPE